MSVIFISSWGPAKVFDDNSLIESQATTGRNATFFQSLAFDKELGATRGIDAVLKAHKLDALVLPAPGFTTTPAGKVETPTAFDCSLTIPSDSPCGISHRHRSVYPQSIRIVS